MTNKINRNFFFIDLDGTLLSSKGKIKRKTRKFLESREDWAICTGRDFAQLNKIKIRMPALVISSNGSEVTFNGSVISISYFSRKELIAICEGWSGTIINFETGEVINSENANTFKKVKKLSLYGSGDAKNLQEYSLNKYEDHIELMPKGVSKGASEFGVKSMLESFGYNRFVHIGDSQNDISVVQFGIKLVAVKNADAGVKKIANMTSRFSNDDGIQNIIKEYEYEK